MTLNAWDALERAIGLAVRAHAGQRDKAGRPYILHLLRVMEAVDDPIEKQAAVLHDFVEDVSGTIVDMEREQISPEAILAVEMLSHVGKDTYADYVIRLSRNPIATRVKLADLNDNYRIGRVAYREEYARDDAQRMQRYVLSYQFLKKEISESEYRRRMQAVTSS